LQAAAFLAAANGTESNARHVSPPRTGFLLGTVARPESGADVEVYVATFPELEGVSGVYFNQKNRSNAHSQAYDTLARQKLWQVSLKLTDLAK